MKTEAKGKIHHSKKLPRRGEKVVSKNILFPEDGSRCHGVSDSTRKVSRSSVWEATQERNQTSLTFFQKTGVDSILFLTAQGK